MKKLLLICFYLIICAIVHAQSIDGFVLGEEKHVVISRIPNNQQYPGLNPNELCYLKYERVGANVKKTHYTFYFKSNILYKLQIALCLYNPNGVDDDLISTIWEEKIVDLSYDLGEPVLLDKGKKTKEGKYYWRTSNMKLVYTGWRGEFVPGGGPRHYGCWPEYFTILTWELTSDTSKQRINSDNKYTASGSGFVLSSNGVVVTNYHVIDGSNGINIFVSRNNEVKKYNAKVLISDKTNDISLLQIDDNSFTKFPALPFAVKTSIVDVGTSVFALGYPMSNILGEEIKVTDGIISSKTGYQGDIVTYQISAPIQPGNSGGPLFDKQGNIVGITNAGIESAQNVGYAIKTSYLKNLIDVAPTPISLPANNSISGLSFTEKIKRLTPYVVLIKTY